MSLMRVLLCLGVLSLTNAFASEVPPNPENFLPQGLLGIQLGEARTTIEERQHLTPSACHVVKPPVSPVGNLVDEICEYALPPDSQLGGVPVKSVFVMSKRNKVTSVVTSTPLKADSDPAVNRLQDYFAGLNVPKLAQRPGEIIFLRMPKTSLSMPERRTFWEASPQVLLRLTEDNAGLLVSYGYAPISLAWDMIHAR